MSNICHENLKKMLLNNFNPNQIKYIYGYGSGIFPQKDNKPKMIDLIFVVDDTINFHWHNLQKNKEHYSKLATCFKPLINHLNDHGTQLYYNPNVLLENQINIKYGVISEFNFLKNLNNWNNLFVSGRFHKPVLCLYDKNKVLNSSN